MSRKDQGRRSDLTLWYNRPNLLTLSESARTERPHVGRGRLTVFLGYGEDTGKAAAMLERGARMRAEGLDVAVGYLAPRKTVPDGMPSVPPRRSLVEGQEYFELDLDALLARRPEVVLVQDLAHTNGPGSRHHKRYQDVEELLASGVDVLTTLNVERVESLNDLVARLSGIAVRETVPDRILDMAHHVELVDLSPAELRVRLAEAGNPDGFMALRQMAFRKAAELQPLVAPGPVTERLLVCVGQGWENRRLLAVGRRQTDRLNAEWTVLHVSRGEDLGDTLQRAEELGARVVTLSGTDVVDTILTYARQHQITRILADKSLGPRLASVEAEVDLYLMGSPSRSTPRFRHLGSLLVILAAGVVAYSLPDYSGTGTVVALMVVWLVMTRLAEHVRAQLKAAQRRQMDTAAVGELLQDLAGAARAEDVRALMAEHGRRVCSGAAFGFGLEPLTGDDRAAAEWALANGRPAGRGTATHSGARAHYLPLRNSDVVGLTGRLPSNEERRLLATFAREAGLALERVQMIEDSRQHELLAAKEKLQTALLNMVSHDFKTPLASITGTLRSLRDDGAYLDEAARLDLVDNACGEAERLSTLVANLLDLNRLEGGACAVRAELCDLSELAVAARDALGAPLELKLELGVREWKLDFVLMHQVLVNLLGNALRHAGGPIRVATSLHEGRLRLVVEDGGTSLTELEAIFEPFHRGPSGGSGLGLSICRAIVEMHAGRIWAERCAEGTRLVVEVP